MHTLDIALLMTWRSFSQMIGSNTCLFMVCCCFLHDGCYASTRGVRVEHFSYPTRTRWCLPVPDPCRKLLPDPTRGYTRTRSLPVGLPLLGIIGLVAYPPGPDHYIALVMMNLFFVVENMCCMHHHH